MKATTTIITKIMTTLGMQQRDAKSAPQETFSSARQLPVRAALNAQIPTLPFNYKAGFPAYEHIISKISLIFKRFSFIFKQLKYKAVRIQIRTACAFTTI